MSKHVLWIDDSPEGMQEIIQPIIRPLWEKEIKSSIYMFGDFDASMRRSTQEVFSEQIKETNQKLQNEFINFLVDNEFNNDEDALEKYYLINDEAENWNGNMKEHSLAHDPLSNAVKDMTNLMKMNVVQDWDNISLTLMPSDQEENPCPEQSMNSVNKIIDLMNISGDKYDIVLLDMVLLRDDLQKLNTTVEGEPKYICPMLSMALYAALKARKINVLMYTAYDFSSEKIIRWENTYKKIFAEENINFYNRIGKKIVGDAHESLVEQIIEILSK